VEEKQFNSAIVEAANRAEATALLIRCGYRVYRPEADIYGEDLVVRTPRNGQLHGVQLKGRATVDWARYGNRELWMLFPSAPYKSSTSRDWFLTRHDRLFDWVKQRHGHTPKWNNAWSYPLLSKDVQELLLPDILSPPSEQGQERFISGSGDLEVYDKDGNRLNFEGIAEQK
jgi:hypothetical protein